MRIKCYNLKCLHERNYKGKFTDDNDIITCTKCRYKLRLGKARIKNEVDLPHNKTNEVSTKTKQNNEVTSQYRKVIEAPKTGFEYPEMKGQHLPTHSKPERKVRVIKDNFIVREIKNNQSIRIIPWDPLAVLKKNGLMVQ